MGGVWDDIPADVLVEILRRIQPRISRIRLRLVCRSWRDVIDERRRVRRASPTTLVFLGSDRGRSRAYILNDNLFGDYVRGRALDLDGSVASNSGGVSMVGTCNGLICLCCERGDVAVLDPRIREQLRVAPATGWSALPAPHASTYSFAYHPETGQYTILHVPRDLSGEIDKVHVFTLWGESSAAWRQVPVPAGSSCDIRFGLLTLDGVTYWVTKDAERIMSFDHKDDRVALVDTPSLPAVLWMEGYAYTGHLADVRGRLGIAVCRPRDGAESADTELWVLEGDREEDREWVKRYTVMAHGKTPCQQIALPRAVHGEHVLTTGRPFKAGRMRRLLSLYAHRQRHDMKLGCRAVRVSARSPGREVREFDGPSLQTFAYFEIWEPLPPRATYYGEEYSSENDGDDSSDDDDHDSSDDDGDG